MNNDQLDGLITHRTTLVCFSVFVKPLPLVETVQCKVLAATNFFANIIVAKQRADELDHELADINASITTIGLPLGYVLNLYTVGQGLPEGAAKYLLYLEVEAECPRFAQVLHEFKNVCPPYLPRELPPQRGIADVHHIWLKTNTPVLTFTYTLWLPKLLLLLLAFS